MCPWTLCLEFLIPWKKHPLDDASLGRCIPGRSIPWTIRPLDDVSLDGAESQVRLKRGATGHTSPYSMYIVSSQSGLSRKVPREGRNILDFLFENTSFGKNRSGKNRFTILWGRGWKRSGIIGPLQEILSLFNNLIFSGQLIIWERCLYYLGWGRILGRNPEKSFQNFPPCYSQSPL